jgi:predicted methyltransferase
MKNARLSLIAATLLMAACSKAPEPASQAAPAPAPEAAAPLEAAPVAEVSPIQAAVDGAWRSSDDRSRDMYRHPVQALEFWGLQPGMTILEVQPGGGWWTEILAPYAYATGGSFSATAPDLDNPELSEQAKVYRQDFANRFAAKPDVYGKVTLVNFGPKSAPLPAEAYDFILTARSVHGWVNSGTQDRMFADFFQALKPGGILALEQHRANEGTDPADPKTGTASGYVMQSAVVAMAEKAGFVLEESSEVNANAADTKDHPFGVWTLPPVARTRPYDEGPDAHDPAFDRTKYDAIGESDRMTLRFRKPAAAPADAGGDMPVEAPAEG